MKIKVLKKASNELSLEIEGEGHTFCNLLQSTLLEDKTIDMAGYDIPHPLTAKTTIYVRTKGRRRPETAIKAAVKKAKKRNKEFKETFEKALNEWQQKQN